jgi:predicted TIM-barrel fold metal-dependent hydrolase
MTQLIDGGRFSRKLEEISPLEDVERIPMVDADTHVTEPADLWTARISVKKWGDLVPHVLPVASRVNQLGDQGPGLGWFIGDTNIAPAPTGTNAGWKLPPPNKPPSYEEAHPASYTLSDRLKLMNDEGVYSQVLYPNVAGFGAQRFLDLKDAELRLECVRAYNDFLFDWTAAAPERFVKVCAVPFWDIKETVKEVERCKARGFTGILFCSYPHEYGQPFLADPYWDPLYSLAEDYDMPINTHIGTGDVGDAFRGWKGAKRANYAMGAALCFFTNARPLMEFCMGGVFARHPKLKVVSVESGIGWAPFLMEAMDHQFFECQVYQEREDFDMLPSEYFKRNCYVCFWFEKTGPMKLLHDIGVEHCLFETDFPHPTSLYPAESVKAHVARSMKDETPEVRRKVLAENAASLYKVQLPVDMKWRTGG